MAMLLTLVTLPAVVLLPSASWCVPPRQSGMLPEATAGGLDTPLRLEVPLRHESAETGRGAAGQPQAHGAFPRPLRPTADDAGVLAGGGAIRAVPSGRPERTVGPEQQEIGDPGRARARPGPPPPETLQQAWALALDVSLPLEAGRWNVSSAQHGLEAARATRWPKVGVDGSYTLRDNEPAFRFDFPGIPLSATTFPYTQDEGFAFRAKVSLPLYTSGRIQHGIAAADSQLASARLELDDAVVELKLQVAEEYVNVLRAQRERELTGSTVRSLEAHVRDVALLFEYHQVPANDLLAARVALSNARQAAIQAGNHLDTSRAAYNRRLGRPLTDPVHLAEQPLETVREDVATLTARALRNRPALARLAARAEALEHQANSVLGENGPQIELLAEYGLEENRYRSPEGIAAAGVGLSWNVFDGGKSRHGAAALLDNAKGVRRLRADLESMIALEVRRAWLFVQETRRRLDVTAQAIQQAEENLRVARKRYSSGVGTNTEVLDAETLRTQTYRNHDNALYDAVLAVLRLRHATGELREQ